MKKTNHTPTPWSYQSDDSQLIRNSKGDVICEVELPMNRERGYDTCNAEQEANAEFIVKAVNCHDELVEALKMLLACGIVAKYPKDDGKTFLNARLYAEQALSKAKGGE